MSSNFKIEFSDAKARRGEFVTRHGNFKTPQFMPVGTRATVKGLDARQIAEAGAKIMLVNTYHLWLRPGPQLIHDLGGIHKFAGWSGPILSDSGGFQVFSLRDIRKISEEGVEFRSHLDGALMFLSPEKAIEIQETLGVDIAMALDECPMAGLDHAKCEKSLELTLRWAKRCIQARTGKSQLFGITQGGTHRDLRTRSAMEISELPFDGFAIGGLSVGEKKEAMYEVLSYHPQDLPSDKIRYLMGVGTPEDIVHAVSEGVDLFDCVMPTRSGRFGRAFVSGEEPYLNIKNSKFQSDSGPLDPNCSCFCCSRYSRGYLNHLFKVGEMLGPQLVSLHNLTHYFDLIREIQLSIETGRFQELFVREKNRWKNVEIGSKGLTAV